MFVSICLSVYLSIYPSIHLSIYLSIDLSIDPSIYISIYLSIDWYRSVSPVFGISRGVAAGATVWRPQRLGINRPVNDDIYIQKGIPARVD